MSLRGSISTASPSFPSHSDSRRSVWDVQAKQWRGIQPRNHSWDCPATHYQHKGGKSRGTSPVCICQQRFHDETFWHDLTSNVFFYGSPGIMSSNIVVILMGLSWQVIYRKLYARFKGPSSRSIDFHSYALTFRCAWKFILWPATWSHVTSADNICHITIAVFKCIQVALVVCMSWWNSITPQAYRGHGDCWARFRPQKTLLVLSITPLVSPVGLVFT